jgi:hypothetical protein
MNTSPAALLTMAAVLAAALPLAACGVVVRENGEGNEKRVDIRSPFGRVTVETNGEMADTGLPAYPGARPLQDGDDHDSANVTVGNSWFGVKIAASKFESEDDPDAVLAFYRQHLRQYGDVTECRGKLDFKRRRGVEQAVCKESPRFDDITLGVGTHDRHRIVAVKPRDGRTRFDVVFIETNDRG